jgi:hypothetical protein
MEAEMATAIVVYEHPFKAFDIQRVKKHAECRAVKRIEEFPSGVFCIMKYLLGHNTLRQPAMYEIKDHESLLFLLMSDYIPLLTYGKESETTSSFAGFAKFAQSIQQVSWFLQSSLHHSSDHLEALQSLAISPKDSDVALAISNSFDAIQEEKAAVMAECRIYFRSICPT